LPPLGVELSMRFSSHRLHICNEVSESQPWQHGWAQVALARVPQARFQERGSSKFFNFFLCGTMPGTKLANGHLRINCLWISHHSSAYLEPNAF